MPRHIAFLRAVNVGGRTVKMDALRERFEALGLTNVETFIASGNVLFETRAKAAAKLQQQIEADLASAFGFEIDTFLRGAEELIAIAKHPAFPAARIAAAPTYCVGFLAAPLGAEALRGLKKFESAIDAFHVNDREVYWLCEKKQSESAFTNAAMEKALKVRATFRNINTVRKLADKVAPG